MNPNRAYTRVFSPITAFAAFSVVALFGAIGWKVHGIFYPAARTSIVASAAASGNTEHESDADADFRAELAGFGLSGSVKASSTPQDIAEIGSNVVGQLATHYAVLQEQGAYTAEAGSAIAQEMAPQVKAHVSFDVFSAAMAKTDADTSYARMLRYRADLRTAFAPLLLNTTPEITIFGMFVQSGDRSYLTQLQTVADNYKIAAANTAQVIAPQDATAYHAGIITAMREFSATLDALIANADDPVTTAALLRSYNQAEADMLNAFNSLTTYYGTKHA